MDTIKNLRRPPPPYAKSYYSDIEDYDPMSNQLTLLGPIPSGNSGLKDSVPSQSPSKPPSPPSTGSQSSLETVRQNPDRLREGEAVDRNTVSPKRPIPEDLSVKRLKYHSLKDAEALKEMRLHLEKEEAGRTRNARVKKGNGGRAGRTANAPPRKKRIKFAPTVTAMSNRSRQFSDSDFSDASSESSDSDSGTAKEPSKTPGKAQEAAKSALVAAATEAFRIRNDTGAWMDPNTAARVLTAALGGACSVDSEK